MHSFTTERLLIRPLLEEDKALFIRLYTNAKVMRNICEPLNDKKAEKAFNNTLKVMKQDKPTSLTWVIVNTANHERMGIQGLSNIEGGIAEIGIMLERSSHGLLVPEEAIRALLEYSFNYLSLIQIDAIYFEKNKATARVSKKVGFTFNCKKQTQIIESVYKSDWQQGNIKSLY